MEKFYYLVAQLPVLEFSVIPETSFAQFLDEAAKWTTAKEIRVLESLAVDMADRETGGPALLVEYAFLCSTLRDETVLWRKAKKDGQDYRAYPDIAAILSDHNPLHIETALLKLRWDFLREKEVGHLFDLDGLIIYGIKLRILERLNKFNKEKGETVFQKICEGEHE